ncbi:hypothetical protein HYR69_09655, partial [Candidatus Sumerlaeota bacterium]|nr:hypothetical protein [Candidatus Sumerlaeota bacterium]
MTRNSLIALIGLFILCSIAQGDAVTLKNGSVVEGRITKENEKEVVIEVDGIGTTFKKSEVAKIEREGKMEAEKADLASEDAPASKEAKYSKPKKPVLTDIPQGLLKDLVAKVGPGGVTREDYQLYQRRLANESGVSSSAFTDAERKKALDKAIEDETLFQAALAAGLLEDNYIRWSIREEYRADLTTGQISPGL